MGKNKKAFIPPLKSKHRNHSNTNALQMEKQGSKTKETENLVMRNPNLEKVTAKISSSLIINVVSNSDDIINELMAGPAEDKATESSYSENDGIFLVDECQKATDVFEFQSSPVMNSLTTKNGRKRSLHDCLKQDEQNQERSMKTKKASLVRQGVLKDIKKMHKAMVLLREREQSLMTSSEQ